MSKSIRVTAKTYEQANTLKEAGYASLTNVLSVAVDRLYRAERLKEDNVSIEKWDRVSIDGQWSGIVVQPGVPKSLVRVQASPGSGADHEQIWFDNDRLIVRQRRREKLTEEEVEIEAY